MRGGENRKLMKILLAPNFGVPRLTIMELPSRRSVIEFDLVTLRAAIG